jgi:hypothetical protein
VVQPNQYAFGGVIRGSWDWPVKTFEVKNVGVVPTGPLFIAPGGPDGSVFTQPGGDGDCYRRMLAPEQSCTFQVEFAPGNPNEPTGPKTSIYTIRDERLETTLSVSGTSLPQPAGSVLTIKPTQADFGSSASGGSGERRSFIVVNIGDESVPINLSVWGATGDTGLFREVSTNCRSMLASSARCVLNLAFDPPSGTPAGAKSAVWVVGVPDHPTINVRVSLAAQVLAEDRRPPGPGKR